jgi:hypothetical protein
MRIGVLNNLRAGKRDSRAEEVMAFLRSHPDVLHIETGSDTILPDALAEFERAGVEVLALNGGDGTIQHALTHLLGGGRRAWLPRIAPIRGGRTNMTAIDLGVRRDAVAGLAALVEAARSGRLEACEIVRDVLRVEYPGTERYGMFLGYGMLHRAVELTHRAFPDGRAQGVFGAGVVTLALVARAALGAARGVLSPDKMRIACDGVAGEPREIVLGMATTLQRLFLRLHPFWGREPAPIRTTAIEAGARRLWRAAPGIMWGRPPAHCVPENGYHSRNVRELAVQLDAGLILDGELFDPQPDRVVRVSAVEGVRFLRA